MDVVPRRRVDAFFDGEPRKRGLGESNLALVGFPQGRMMALYVGMRRAFAGIFGEGCCTAPYSRDKCSARRGVRPRAS